MAKCWYVVRTRPNCDHLAASALRGQGFELFFPKVRVHQPHRGVTESPLFPGYLFLRFAAGGYALPSVERLPGVLGWLRFDDEVPSVTDEVVSELAHRVKAINSAGGLWSRFRAGQQVRVVAGGMETLASVVEEAASPNERVQVLLEFMGRQVQTSVAWQQLQPADSVTDGGEPLKKSRRTRGRGRWISGFGPRAAASAV